MVNNVDMVQREKEASRKEPSPDSRVFTEPELANKPATAAAPVINNSNQGDGTHVKEEAKDVETVPVIPQVEIKVEDRTVVEENNKNEGKSRDAKESVESSSSSSNAVDTEESLDDRTIENTAPPVIKKDRMELKYTYREGRCHQTMHSLVGH